MKISVVGAGYVGLAFSSVLADLGHLVYVVRKDKKKNEALKKGKTHFYDPGLEELVEKDLASGKLIPTTSYEEAIPNSEVIFICVGTPSKTNGDIDLSQVFEAAEEIGKNLKTGYTVVAVKSTVLPGTTARVGRILEKKKKKSAHFSLGFCPEFLREGSAIEDTRRPDRVVIGASDKKAIGILKTIHRDFKAPFLLTGITAAEMIKYAANNYLALRIVFANQIADLCEKSGADINEVLKGIGLDKRIGLHYWYPGLGYAGSCFPKDVAALAAYADKVGLKKSIFRKMHELNLRRPEEILKRLEKEFGSFSGKTIGILGLACKKGTDDIRKSAALKFIEILKEKKAEIMAYDPLAMENTRRLYPEINYGRNGYEAAKGADILLILTDTEEFARMDFKKVKKLMKGNFIFDSRNILDKNKVESLNFIYKGVGR
ncbi:MAG: UDP-glucose 6-dehydrogenase TuaD [Microgenomates group bacterium ADurb.Bin219]|nr:MAG: UDP-glucose 6-dehydrogenase TuaD [Microgenomates group bacterium ADurb.Bin219]HNP89632.1 UDP-glucose/GDP-mannose dehydrogenase family protein [Candidatus Woesebacteria bacterium]